MLHMNSDASLKSFNNSKYAVINHKILMYARLARPNQYIKNSFILLPVFFGYKLATSDAILNSVYAFLAFSLTASAVYVLNDIMDINEDRKHPRKKNRPLASGSLSTHKAIVFIFCLLTASLCISLLLLPLQFIVILAAYLLLNLGYSFYLKHIAIVDVICISAGFVLRVIAGGFVSSVPVSFWIIIMTFLIAIFLALGKRRDDLLVLYSGSSTRKCLNGYNLEFVSLSMVIMASVVIVAYILYCVSPEVIQKHSTDNLYFTGFWVIVGLLRYLQITFVDGKSGSPTHILLHDYFLWTVIAGWISTFYWLIYVADK